jgi:hypothetical protein
MDSIDFIVIARGTLGDRITQLAEEHAAFDPEHRRVVQYDGPTLHDARIAAMSIDRNGGYRLLNAIEATQEARIEAAFVRGSLTVFAL